MRAYISLFKAPSILLLDKKELYSPRMECFVKVRLAFMMFAKNM